MRIRILLENIRIAWNALRSQGTRSILTIFIIAFGITALVGILTATSAIESTITGNFASLGANTFTIQNRSSEIQIGQRSRKRVLYTPIDKTQAAQFKEKTSEFPWVVSRSYTTTNSAEVKFQSKKTDPNTTVFAADDHFLITNGYTLRSGRNFSASEASSGANVVIIGEEIAEKLFPRSNPVGENINLKGKSMQIIGVLAEKGSSASFSGDRNIIIPLPTAAALYPNSWVRTHSINVMVSSAYELDDAIQECMGIMRIVRGLRPKDPNNFSIVRSDSLSNSLISQLSYVTIAASFIGFITLLGAAIALMNIMLVSVTERTKEIGTRKAMGATPGVIRFQFLTEAVLLGQIGGILGVILGILVGNWVAWLIEGAFIMPWPWVILGLSLCLFTGIVSGYYPARKASRLDPVEALRFE